MLAIPILVQVDAVPNLSILYDIYAFTLYSGPEIGLANLFSVNDKIKAKIFENFILAQQKRFSLFRLFNENVSVLHSL
jgi:hypothetical protein